MGVYEQLIISSLVIFKRHSGKRQRGSPTWGAWERTHTNGTIHTDPAHNSRVLVLCGQVIVIKVITAALHHAPIETLWDINKRKQEFNEKPLCPRRALQCAVVSIFFLAVWSRGRVTRSLKNAAWNFEGLSIMADIYDL